MFIFDHLIFSIYCKQVPPIKHSCQIQLGSVCKSMWFFCIYTSYQVYLYRSTDDGYTPTEQVGFIQKLVLDMLSCVYDKQLDIHHCYLNS